MAQTDWFSETSKVPDICRMPRRKFLDPTELCRRIRIKTIDILVDFAIRLHGDCGTECGSPATAFSQESEIVGRLAKTDILRELFSGRLSQALVYLGCRMYHSLRQRF